MLLGRVKVIAVFLVALVVFGTPAAAGAVAQPSYDTMRVESGGTGLPYQVWVAWSPLVLTTPDGGAWSLFSAEVVQPDGTLGTKKLYATRFDPQAGVWQPAVAMVGGEIQFGATGVIDAAGTVHVIFSDRAQDDPAAFATLVYTRTTPEGGWTEPVAVAPNETAGHQLSPSLVLDANGAMHLLWQDQRGLSDELRALSASNADVFACTLSAEGTCAEPVQVSVRTTPETNASRPEVVLDGNRLIAVWSIYEGTTEEDLATAQRLEWSSVTLGEEGAAWATPRTLVEREGGLIGGLLVDLEADPTGGAVLVFGRRTDQNFLYLRRLTAESADWSDAVILASGDRGSFPKASVGADGTVYVAYNLGSGMTVQVGAVALAPGQTRASAETMVTQGEDGAQGRPVIEVDANGRIWIIYLHEPTGGVANEVRSLRGAIIPSEPAAQAPATPIPAASPAPAATPTT